MTYYNLVKLAEDSKVEESKKRSLKHIGYGLTGAGLGTFSLTKGFDHLDQLAERNKQLKELKETGIDRIKRLKGKAATTAGLLGAGTVGLGVLGASAARLQQERGLLRRRKQVD